MELLLWLNPAKINAAGTLPLSLRITVQARRAEYATKIRLTPAEWDQQRQRLRGDSEAVRLLNKSLKTLLARATVNRDSLQAACDGSPLAPRLTARLVADSLRPAPVACQGVGQVLEEMRQQHYAAGNANTFANYAAGLQAWGVWRAGTDVAVDALTVAVASQFAGYLRRYAPTTRALYLNQLHTLFSKARPRADNPFAGLADGRAAEHAGPRVPLTRDQLDALQALPLDPHSPAGLARVVFLCSYYLHGIRLLNVLTLRWCDFAGGRVAVAAMKRGTAKNLQVPAALAALLAHYPAGSGRAASAPLLPLLAADYFARSGAEQLKEKKRVAAAVNGCLNRLAKHVGVVRLHAHLARHTLAAAAHLATGSTWTVKELLGHRNIAQTETYLQSMSTAQQDAAGDLIYGK